MAQAAATPKTRFKGTAMPAASKVRRIAERASGSSRLAQYTPIPFANAWEKTIAQGRKIKPPRKETARPIRTQRTAADSPVAAVATRRAGEKFRVLRGRVVALARTSPQPPQTAHS